MALPRIRRSWRNALVATTGLSALAVLADGLWTAGFPEWAFALAFLGIWALISISWSSVDFNEESSLVLAEIVDSNFQDLYDRLEELEREVDILRNRNAQLTAQTALHR